MSAANCHRHGFAISAARVLVSLGVSACVLPRASAAELALDVASCAALAAAAQRGGGHFPLGRAACGLVEPPAPRVAPASSHARQLQLYAPEAAAAPVVPAATSSGMAAPGQKKGANGTKGTNGATGAKGTKGTKANPVPAVGMEARPLPAPLMRAVQLAPEIDRVAAGNQIDPLLLHAIARVESQHNPAAVSHAGARGLMQVMPATGARFGANSAAELHIVPINLEVSARYLKVLKRRFPGDLQLVLAAYNAGEGAVERHGRRIPPYAETQAYVRKVLHEYSLLRGAAEGLR